MFLRFFSSFALRWREPSSPWAGRLALATLLAVGCGDTTAYDLDGGARDAMVVEARSLEIVGDPTFFLTPGEMAELAVRLRDPRGALLAGKEVRFALSGRAHDSTLGTVAAITDDMGIARTTLSGGTVSAAFRVRASSDDAASVAFDVAVGSAGFGELMVRPRYEGDREPLPRTVVGVFADATCDDEFVRSESGDRSLAYDTDAGAARFLGLPVGIPYAVTVRSEGESSTLVAWGCVDGVTVALGESTEVVVPFADEPLVVDGSYDLTAAFDMLNTAEALAAELTTARGALLGAGDATLILREAEQQLTEAGDPDAARMTEARSGGLDAAYQALLEDAGLGPSVAHDALVAAIQMELIDLRIVGRLRAIGDELTYAVRALDLATGELDVALAGLEIGATLDGTLTAQTLTVESLTIELSASDAVRALATGHAFDLILPGPAAWLAAEAGCARLPALPEPAGCDGPCLDQACRAVVGRHWEEAIALVEAFDEERALLDLEGSASAADRFVDLQIDSFDGSLEGEWTGPMATSPEPVAGELTGERITPPR